MESKKIVITRPRDQGRAFVGEFADIDSRNFILEPLLEIHPLPIRFPEADKYGAVLVTSAHGVHALHDKDGWLQKPFYCVGESVSGLLKQRGAENILMTRPTASELSQAMKQQPPKENLQILYMRGRDIAFDMKDALEACGYKVDELECYNAVAATKFSAAFLNAVKDRQISAITFFSSRTAGIFTVLVNELDILADLRGIKALCISPGVVECLHSIFYGNIEVSDSPDMCGMKVLVRQAMLVNH